MTPAPHRQPLATLAPLVERRGVTAEALLEACLGEIARANGELNVFIAVLTDDARAQARQADREIRGGRYRGPLHGIPISVKDLIDIQGITTTAASRVRIGHRALRDARVIARLRAAGAVFVGKTNLHEFAFGVTNEDSAFGPARNPHDPSRSPGGSSGGSAAAIAAGMCVASVGTDTGGSIRIPAAACGIVGLKPHTGALSLAGVVPLSPTMDHVGPMARTVADARLLFAAMAGRAPVERRPLDEDIVPIYLHISLAEASRYHAPALERTPEDYTKPVRLRLELGRYVLAEDYLRALEGRRALRAEVDAALAGRSGLILPTLPIPAPPLFASTVEIEQRPEPVRAALLRLTQLFNMTGHPAISIPCGTTPAGLPCGCQLVGPHGDTARLLDLAEALEPRIVVSAPSENP